MSDTHPTIRVISLHRLPFDKAAFDDDVRFEGRDPELDARLRKQYRENWDNAWLVVVEYDGSGEYLDFDAFWYDAGTDNQAAWLERVLEEQPSRTRAAFYLHYVIPDRPLNYGDERLPFPPPSTPSPELLRQMPYSSPD